MENINKLHKFEPNSYDPDIFNRVWSAKLCLKDFNSQIVKFDFQLYFRVDELFLTPSPSSPFPVGGRIDLFYTRSGRREEKYNPWQNVVFLSYYYKCDIYIDIWVIHVSSGMKKTVVHFSVSCELCIFCAYSWCINSLIQWCNSWFINLLIHWCTSRSLDPLIPLMQKLIDQSIDSMNYSINSWLP